MADILKLKKKAADLEAKKQGEKALDVYREIIEAYEAGEEDTVDIPLYNRVGDMLQKAGSLPEAVSVWEKAVDHYTDGGFYNPAIALCNKILRASPGRTVIYYKLGKIHAEKGFKGDARQNFLEYANRQQKAGNLDDAFKALKEFADLVPDQHDVRMMLADQLVKAGRNDEAIEQLQLGYAQASADGEDDTAEQIVAKMKEIDPTVEPKAEGPSSSGGGGGLVFLDIGASDSPKRQSKKMTPGIAKRASKAVQGLELLVPAPTEGPSAKPPAKAPVKPAAEAPAAAAAAPPAPAKREPAPEPPADDLVLEPTQLGDAPPPPRGSVVGLETTSIELDEAPEIPLLEIEPTVEAEAPPPAEVPLLEIEPTVEAEAATPARDEPPLIELEPTDLGGTPAGGTALVEDATSEPMLPEDAEPVEFEIDIEPTLGESRSTAETGTSAFDDDLLDIEPSFGSDMPAFADPPQDTDLPLIELEEETEETSAEASIFDAPELESDSASEPELDEEVEPAAAQVPDAAPELVSEPEPAAEATVDLPLLTDDAEDDAEALVEPSTAALASRVDELLARAEIDPNDWAIRRELAEALLEQGNRDVALQELEVSMVGYEHNGDLDTAGSIAEEIVRLQPTSIRHHQKRVEYAFRANDRMRLAEAYVELADALLADGQALKARAVYQRVLDIRPDDLRAQAAIESIPDEPAPAPAPRRSTHAPAARPSPAAPAATPSSAPAVDDDGYVSLGDWLREDDEPKSTRMVVEEQEPTGDEAADFADMLRKFKQGVSDNVDDEDHEAHYDLGVAYKEMGLLDEAIAEFQKALRGTTERARTFESLGHCFIEKGQLPVASTILQRALAEPGVRDEALIGVLYLLGAISEELQQFADAKRYYERVFAVDIQFRDVGDRLNVVEQQLT